MSSDHRDESLRQALSPLEKAQSELRLLRQELEHLHRLAMTGTVAAGVAHEINNLLSPALAYAQLTQTTPDDPNLVAKASRHITSAIKNAAEMLDAMLDFSAKPRESPYAHLGTVLHAALNCLGRDPAKHGLQLSCDVPATAAVAMRPLALQQVLLNLLVNAIRALTACRHASGRIAVSATNPKPDLVVLSVSDNGPGIPEEIADTLFDPFVSSARQADTSPGRGLGLSVCQHLVEAVGGIISVHETPGGGATFTLHLPAAQQTPLAKAG